MISSKYKLFVDDERFPPNDGGNWIIVRNIEQTQAAIEQYGFPDFVSFDHDLGDNQATGYDIAHWMVNLDMDGTVIPDDFEFYVHSQNPIGARNIHQLLTSYLNFRK